MIIPNIWENKTCSKPPTRCSCRTCEFVDPGWSGNHTGTTFCHCPKATAFVADLAEVTGSLWFKALSLPLAVTCAVKNGLRIFDLFHMPSIFWVLLLLKNPREHLHHDARAACLCAWRLCGWGLRFCTHWPCFTATWIDVGLGHFAPVIRRNKNQPARIFSTSLAVWMFWLPFSKFFLKVRRFADTACISFDSSAPRSLWHPIRCNPAGQWLRNTPQWQPTGSQSKHVHERSHHIPPQPLTSPTQHHQRNTI